MADIEATPVAPTATTTPADPKPSDVVADAAKKVAESNETDEQTLLGETGEKAEGETGKVEPLAPPVVPDKYEVKAPEGMELNTAMLEGLTPTFKELGLTQEAVQKLSDAFAPQMKQMAEQQQKQAIESYKQVVSEWKAAAQKELGAEAGKELAYAGKFIEKYGDPEVRELLNETGVGNHKAMVRLFIKAGKAISSDSYPDSGKKGKGEMSEADAADILFPTSKK